jgi:hypothetical protein
MKALIVSFLLVSSLAIPALAQESLLDEVKDSVQSTEYVSNAFKSTRIINGQSIEMLGAGSLDFRILHRFGLISQGIDQLWGLDQSTTRLSFDYAPIHNVLVGFGRSSAKKELDGFVKYRLIQQSRGETVMPVSVVLTAGMMCQTLPWEDTTHPNYFTSRLSFFQQVLVGSKISDAFSVQLMPTLLHRNLVDFVTDASDIFALGIGGRIKVTNRIAFTFEYYHSFNGMHNVNMDPISVGFDIETGGHVFQVHLSNAVGMNERSFLTETVNDWTKGQIQLGFNISRVFQL